MFSRKYSLFRAENGQYLVLVDHDRINSDKEQKTHLILNKCQVVFCISFVINQTNKQSYEERLKNRAAKNQRMSDILLEFPLHQH